MKKESLGLDEGREVDKHMESLRATLKKAPYWKTPIYDGMHGFWLKKFIAIYDSWLLN